MHYSENLFNQPMYNKVQPNTTPYSEFMHYRKNLCTACSELWEFILPPSQCQAKYSVRLAKEEDK